MEIVRYVFVDGGYVRERLNAAMMRVFGVPGELAPEAIVPANAFRTYFYDCLDDVKRGSETDADLESRIDAQRKQLLSRRHAKRGLHLQFGTLKGGKRRSQKEVDVLLAVDMMTHAFNRNMTNAVLISGDLDFRPVVEAVVRSGVFVEVWYEKESTDEALPGAADFGSVLDWQTLYLWNKEEFREKYKPPVMHTHPPFPDYNLVHKAAGYFADRPVELMEIPGTNRFMLRAQLSYGPEWFEHHDRDVIDRFFAMRHGSIKWK